MFLVFVKRSVRDTVNWEGSSGVREGLASQIGSFDTDPDPEGGTRYFVAGFALRGHAEKYQHWLSNNFDEDDYLDYPDGKI